MVRGRNDDYVARQLIQLHEQEGHDAFDLASLVRVTALFSDRVEFVEKQDAWLRPNIIKKSPQTGIRLAEIASNQGVIPYDKER